MTTFEIILDNLVRHGVPSALERANEIEAEMSQPAKRTPSTDECVEWLFAELIKLYPEYVTGYKYYKHSDTGNPMKRVKNEVKQTTIEDIKGKKRFRELVLSRHIFGYLLFYQNGFKLWRIGELLGNRDHSAVLHGRDAISNLIQTDRNFRRVLNDLESRYKTFVNGY